MGGLSKMKKILIILVLFFGLMKDSISYGTSDCTAGTGELVCSNEKILLEYDFYNISKYGLDSNKIDFKNIDITYYQLPEMLSSDLSYYRIEDCNNGVLLNRNILIDRQNSILIVLRRKTESESFEILNAVEFDKKDILKDINIILGYSDGPLIKTVLTDEDNNIYIVENDTLKVLKKINMKNWKTLSGHLDTANPTGEKWDKVFLYQINQNKNKIRKFDILSSEVLYEYNLSNSPIKGKITTIKYESGGVIYISSKLNDKYAIYLANERTFDYFEICNNIYTKPIKNMWPYYGNNMFYLAIFQPTNEYPIKLIEMTDEETWKEIK